MQLYQKIKTIKETLKLAPIFPRKEIKNNSLAPESRKKTLILDKEAGKSKSPLFQNSCEQYLRQRKHQKFMETLKENPAGKSRNLNKRKNQTQIINLSNNFNFDRQNSRILETNESLLDKNFNHTKNLSLNKSSFESIHNERLLFSDVKFNEKEGKRKSNNLKNNTFAAIYHELQSRIKNEIEYIFM